jgi:hypothetical protein
VSDVAFEVAALVVMGCVRLAVQVSFLRSCILYRCIRHYVRVRKILKTTETIRLLRGQRQSMRDLLFTRTMAVDPGTRTTLHPLHNVRFIDGSLNNGLNDSKLFKWRHLHLDGRFLPNDLQRMNVAPREIIHGFLSSDNAFPFSFGCFWGR